MRRAVLVEKGEFRTYYVPGLVGVLVIPERYSFSLPKYVVSSESAGRAELRLRNW
jgi:hypothetical protein